MEHGLRYIAFYVQKRKTPRAVCYEFTLVSDKQIGAPAVVRLADVVIPAWYSVADIKTLSNVVVISGLMSDMYLIYM